MAIAALRERFAIPGVVGVVAGNGGLAKVVVTTGVATGEIYLHGAQVTSWRPAGADEVLFVSERSRWEDGRAVRGGIPVCFPWFRGKADDAKAPAHGVVRTKSWELERVEQEGDGVVVVLATENDAASERWWPHAFRIENRITVGSELKLELAVTHKGGEDAEPMRFEEALHTYFAVGDATKVRVTGLDDVAWLDNMDGNREKLQAGDVMFERATDSAYLDTERAVELVDPVLGRRVRTEKAGSRTTVVWNPWKEGAAALADLGDEEWARMACVEASNILEYAVVLGPGGRHTMSAVLTVG